MLFPRIRSAYGKGDRVTSKEATIYLRRSLGTIGIGRYSQYRALQLCIAPFMWLCSVGLCGGFLLSWVLDTDKFTQNEFLTSLQVGLSSQGLVVKMAILASMHQRLQRADAYLERLDERCTQPEERERIRWLAVLGNRATFAITAFYFAYSFGAFSVQLWSGHPLYSLYNPVSDWRDGHRQLLAQSFVELVAVTTAIFQVATADIYPVIYLTIIRTHLKILSQRIRRLGADGAAPNACKGSEELVQCILDHKNIYRMFETVRPVISRTIFVQFVLTGCVLGLTMLNIQLFPNMSNVIASLLYVVDVMLQMMPTAYCANALRDDCDDLALAIFHSNWPEQDEQFKKKSLLFMQRTQKPLELTALKMIPITIAASLNMAKFAFTVYTVMNKVNFGK